MGIIFDIKNQIKLNENENKNKNKNKKVKTKKDIYKKKTTIKIKNK
jgi:hypothetical protein